MALDVVLNSGALHLAGGADGAQAPRTETVGRLQTSWTLVTQVIALGSIKAAPRSRAALGFLVNQSTFRALAKSLVTN